MTAFQSFEHLRSQKIDALNVEIHEYRHKATGAQHIHISADNNENVFLVALRTVPQDSKGVAHILEHTALCGSEKYQVRDPFFMMIRRSLNTYMNAMTSSDWTAYPFASQNKKDFNNLLDVYLDAVFFPKLDPLDFAQEGHRLEFAEMKNPESSLEFKGVVFNEMKGAMSSPTSILWQTMSKYLYPTTTYHYNSGGDPEVITDLSYEELINFHKTHYHPSNAIFMTFGDMDAADLQKEFEQKALNRFSPLDHEIRVPLEKRYDKPMRATESYNIPADEGTDNKTHVVMGWLLGESINLKKAMQAHLLTSVLLENSASPLQLALETSELGRAPSPLCGLDDSQLEMAFVCGLEGTDADSTGKVEQLILDTLHKVAKDGATQDQMEACLHQLELQQREISGDSYPFGLQLILQSLNSATHRGDPVALLDLEPVIAEMRKEIQDPEYIKNLCRELLLDNPHRVTLSLVPDTELADKKQQDERSRLDHIRENLNEDEINKIVAQAVALSERQNQHDDPANLPKVGLEDVSRKYSQPEPEAISQSTTPIFSYGAGTNGLVYQEVVLELPDLTLEEIKLLPLLSHFWTELGVADKSYLDVQQWQSSVSGGLNCSFKVQADPWDTNKAKGLILLSGKALKRNQSALSDLMNQTLSSVRFDESGRVRELVSHGRARAENQVTGSGHGLAMSAAAQNSSPSALLAFQTSGLAGIQSLKTLDNSLKDNSDLGQFMQRLQTLHQKLLSSARKLLVIGEAADLVDFRASLGDMQVSQPSSDAYLSLPMPENFAANELWVANSQVNFCAKAYKTVPTTHPDAPALTVLSGFMRNNFLHTCIREQGGAYGGGATQDNYSGSFKFFSYRDPRLEGTLDDFDRAIDWMLQTDHEARLLEEAVLGVVGGLDKPGSPAGEAKQAFHGDLYGRTSEIKKTFRDRVLETSMEDLKRVTETYLKKEFASTAVLTGKQGEGSAQPLGLTTKKL